MIEYVTLAKYEKLTYLDALKIYMASSMVDSPLNLFVPPFRNVPSKSF